MPSAFGNERLRYARAKREGFSLIVVLIIAIIGLAIVGGIVQMSVTSGSGGRISSAGNTKYNFMQDAVEAGKAALKDAMDKPPPFKALRYPNWSTTKRVEQLSDLLIDFEFQPGLGKGVVSNKNYSRADLGRLGIAGNGGTLSVMIYDMQYSTKASDFAVPNPSRDFDMLPPSVLMEGMSSGWTGGKPTLGSGTIDDAGVYLVRAVLTIEGKETILDSALIQAINN